MSAEPQLIRFAALPSQPWANGGGRTTTIVQSPPDAGPTEVDWRVSVAEIEGESVFSDFTGYERWFASLDPSGIDLTIDGRMVSLAAEEPVAFPGSARVVAQPRGPRAQDLNLMTRSSGFHGSMRMLEFAAGERIVAAGADGNTDVWRVLMLLSGTMSLKGDPQGCLDRSLDSIVLGPAVQRRTVLGIAVTAVHGVELRIQRS